MNKLIFWLFPLLVQATNDEYKYLSISGGQEFVVWESVNGADNSKFYKYFSISGGQEFVVWESVNGADNSKFGMF